MSRSRYVIGDCIYFKGQKAKMWFKFCEVAQHGWRFPVGGLIFPGDDSDLFRPHMVISYTMCVIPASRGAFLAHLREVDAERVGFVLPGYVDLGLGGPTFALDLCVPRQSERRLLGDQLRKDPTNTWQEIRDTQRRIFFFYPFSIHFYARLCRATDISRKHVRLFLLEIQTKKCTFIDKKWYRKILSLSSDSWWRIQCDVSILRTTTHQRSRFHTRVWCPQNTRSLLISMKTVHLNTIKNIFACKTTFS